MWLIEQAGWAVTGRVAAWWRCAGGVQGGQSTVEYALVGAIVVIAAAAALTALSGELTAVFTHITNTLRGVAR